MRVCYRVDVVDNPMYVDPEDLDKEVEEKIPSDKEAVVNNWTADGDETTEANGGTKL